MSGRKYGLKVKARPFRCEVCGRVQIITTNHRGECIDYCGRPGTELKPGSISGGGCSWAPSKGPGVPFNGRTYRRFTYAPGFGAEMKRRGY